MKRIILLLLGIALIGGYARAAELEYFNVYKPKEGMTADEIMKIKYFNKYTLFAHDVQYTGKAYLIDKSGATRERSTARKRIILGGKSDGIAYKDLVFFTAPTQVKGLGILTWSYLDPKKDQDAWLWLPSLKRIRKISQAEGDDSFMGSDFTVEDIVTRRFEDEIYKLIGEENFPGYPSEFMKKTYYKDIPCYVIEAIPKMLNWYYTKRIIWVDKNYGTNIYEEKFDAKGKKFQTILRWHEIYKVDGKEFPIQIYLEGKNLRSGYTTEIINETVKINEDIPEDEFTETVLSRSRW